MSKMMMNDVLNEMAPACQIISVLFFVSVYFSANGRRHDTQAHYEGNDSNLHKHVIQKWEFELDDRLDYPRGDKEKLRRISELWSQYYACSRKLGRSLTSEGRLPSIYLAAYEQAVIHLSCGLCIAPDQLGAIEWLYTQSVKGPYSSLAYNERVVKTNKGDLVIYALRLEDAGKYRCRLGQSTSGPIYLDVVDKNEPYDLVKPYTSRGPFPIQSHHFTHNGISLTTFPSWTPWSECSSCDQVGRRRKYGLCYVKINSNTRNYSSHSHQKAQDETDSITSKNALLKLFQDFPGGIPCGSRLLPANLRSRSVVAQRRNQIMIGLCKVPCDKRSVFEVRTRSGSLLERANNSEGVYSLSQQVPVEPPPPVSETVFAAIGDRVTLFCPGTSLRDMPVNWRVGNKKLIPRDVDKSSAGRVHLNARDGLVFTEITFGDSNHYSCWQRDVLVGAVKLEVWDARPYWSRHVLLLAALVVACAALRATDNVLRNKRRRALR